MNRQTEEGADLERRVFLRRAATASFAILTVLSWSAGGARADDGEDHDSGDSGADSGGDGGHGNDGGNNNSGGGDDHGGSSGGNSGSGSDDSGSGSDSGGGDDNGSDGGFGRGTLDQSDAERAVLLGEAIPLKVALRRVEDAYGGSVIDVNLRSNGRRLEYSFKIRTDRGSVRTIRMDAGSGRFLGLGALFR